MLKHNDTTLCLPHGLEVMFENKAGSDLSPTSPQILYILTC